MNADGQRFEQAVEAGGTAHANEFHEALFEGAGITRGGSLEPRREPARVLGQASRRNSSVSWSAGMWSGSTTVSCTSAICTCAHPAASHDARERRDARARRLACSMRELSSVSSSSAVTPGTSVSPATPWARSSARRSSTPGTALESCSPSEMKPSRATTSDQRGSAVREQARRSRRPRPEPTGGESGSSADTGAGSCRRSTGPGSLALCRARAPSSLPRYPPGLEVRAICLRPMYRVSVPYRLATRKPR